MASAAKMTFHTIFILYKFVSTMDAILTFVWQGFQVELLL